MLSCDAAPTKGSVNLMGNAIAELTLQDYPELGQGGQVFIPLCCLFIGSWLALEGSMILGEAVFFG